MTETAAPVKMAQARITDELLDEMRSRVGTVKSRLPNNGTPTVGNIFKLVQGIGDPNPLWRDEQYAKTTRYGGIVAPPSWILTCFAGKQEGWRGLGAFHNGSDLTFYRPVRVGDQFTQQSVYEGFDGPHPSAFAGRGVTDHNRDLIHNDRGELVFEHHNTIFRFERGEAEAREATRTSEESIVLPHPWTADELAAIEAQILAEKPRGAEVRWWDDVEVGEELDTPIIKGPVGVTDIVAFCIGAWGGLGAHRWALQQYARKPAWGFRDPETHAMEPIFAVHYSHSAARAMGVPMSYDVGLQRQLWQIHLLTDWMGDDGWLKQCSAQYRSFVYLSDVVRFGGRITDKYVDDEGEHVVAIETWAINQRGKNTMPGSAVVALPARHTSYHPLDRRL